MAGRKANPSTILIASLASESLDPMWSSVPSPVFHEAMIEFENRAREDQNIDEEEDNAYEESGILKRGTGKKRRLSARQVKFLERSFDEENRLEPKRKAQLAKELGLQPRQVAIWFQNRRARLKTKQLEEEYGELKERFDKLRVEFDCILKENQHLKEQVLLLKDKLQTREKLEPVNNISEPDQKSNVNMIKLEETSSASRTSSGPLGSDGSYVTNLNNPMPMLLEERPANSSHVFDPDGPEFSQEEGDSLDFLKLDHGAYVDPMTSSCGFELTAELDQELWSWSC